MTPAKRRPDTPANQGGKRPTVPDVPTAPPNASAPDEVVTDPVTPAATADATQLLGPDGGPLAQEASTEDASPDPAPPRETKQPEDRATTQSRSRALHQRIWPD